MAEQKISEIMETTMEKIKTMVDANTIIGDKIVVDDVTIIPISRLSFGFASGATDFAGKNKMKHFIPSNYLTLAMPWKLFLEMEASAPDCFFNRPTFAALMEK